MEIVFRSQEKPFGMIAGNKALFLQLQDSPEDAKCLHFVWQENQSDDMSTYQNTNFLILEPAETQENRNDPQVYLSHQPVINPNKHEEMRRVCNAASDLEGQSLNKSLFIGPGLLQNLVEIVFRSQEKPFGMIAGNKALFLQVQDSPEDAKCLHFVWQEKQSDDMSTYQNTSFRILEPAEIQENRNDPEVYMPHQLVINPNKHEEVRRVCNAASELEGNP